MSAPRLGVLVGDSVCSRTFDVFRQHSPAVRPEHGHVSRRTGISGLVLRKVHFAKIATYTLYSNEIAASWNDCASREGKSVGQIDLCDA